MTERDCILQRGLDLVTREETFVQEEREAFEEFREAVKLSGTSQPDDAVEQSETDTLLTTYRQTVMSTPDYDLSYGDSLQESVRQEFPRDVANPLLSNRRFIQRLKSRTLVATATAIERRTDALHTLQAERKSLESAAATIDAIEEELKRIPRYRAAEASIDTLIETRRRYEELVAECERAIFRRQQQIQQRYPERDFTLNEYLYEELSTTYPVLSVMTSTLENVSERMEMKDARTNEEADVPH